MSDAQVYIDALLLTLGTGCVPAPRSEWRNERSAFAA